MAYAVNSIVRPASPGWLRTSWRKSLENPSKRGLIWFSHREPNSLRNFGFVMVVSIADVDLARIFLSTKFKNWSSSKTTGPTTREWPATQGWRVIGLVDSTSYEIASYDTRVSLAYAREIRDAKRDGAGRPGTRSLRLYHRRNRRRRRRPGHS